MIRESAGPAPLLALFTVLRMLPNVPLLKFVSGSLALEMIEQGEKLAAKLEAEILMRRPGKILDQSHMTSQ